MDKKATNKQINYLNYILNSEPLNNYTDKPLNELTHFDVNNILKKLGMSFSPNFTNLKYIIKEEYSNYKIGVQINVNTNKKIDLICFDYFLIVDWDLEENQTKQELLEKIKNNLINYPYTFLIYETFNGYHGYLMNAKFYYSDINTIKLLKEFNCDKFYIGFTRKVGFVIRLKKKENRNEEFIEKFSCKINDYPILPELQNLLDIKDNLLFY